MSSASALRVVPAPDPRPPVVSADEAYRTRAPYVQDALSLDFGDPTAARPTFDEEPLSEAHPLVTRLAQAFVEVMAGVRPPQQVLRWVSPSVYAVLSRRAFVAARRPPAAVRRAVVRRVRVQTPAAGVLEACAVVVHHDRVRALALRLTAHDQRWVVTELAVG